jgi:hypothetical protein
VLGDARRYAFPLTTPMDIPDTRVFDWLGIDPDGVPYYLHPLNLNWSEAGPEHDLTLFQSVGKRLESEPEYWSQIIRTQAWRHTLVGCVCVMLTRRSDRFADLAHRFNHGSFVVPQVAMTMGIVYPDLAAFHFNTFLNEQNTVRDYKQITSAQAVLAKLGITRSMDLRTEELESHDKHDAEVGHRVIENQWDFWHQHSSCCPNKA